MKNLLDRRNVRNDPKKDFNACEDFLITVIKGLVISAAMDVTSINSLDDSPPNSRVPEDAWLLPNPEREQLLSLVIDQIMSKFVDFSYNSHDTTVRNKDLVTEYAKQLLSLGLFYLEYRDSIREGDGERVLRCWKYLLPIFYNANRTNCSKEALLLLCQHRYLLTERQSKRLLYSRFINTKGGRGLNVPCDLHMEHLNKLCKESVRDLGANKTPIAIERVSKTLGAMDPIMQQFDKVNDIVTSSGRHKKPSCRQDIEAIVSECKKYEILVPQTDRTSHPSFSRLKSLLHSKTKTKSVVEYIKDNLPN